MKHPHRDSNAGLRLRRPTLYPLSYGGMMNRFYHGEKYLASRHAQFGTLIFADKGGVIMLSYLEHDSEVLIIQLLSGYK